MGKMFVVLRQEYLNRVRTRAFVLGTVAIPLLMVVLLVLPTVLMKIDVEKPAKYALVDSTGVMLQPLSAALADTNQAGQRIYTFEPEDPQGRDRQTLEKELADRVNKEELGGFLVLSRDFVEGGLASLYARNVSDPERNDRIRRALDQAARKVRVERSDLSSDQVRDILRQVKLSTFRVAGTGQAEKDEGHTFALAYLVGFLFYISLLMYGAMTLRTTLEEKMSRSAELMVSTVRPVHLMGGKVLGVALVGLTQLTIWGISGYLLMQKGAAIPGQVGMFVQGMQTITPPLSLGLFFLVFFLLGFLFYSGLFVSVGAMVNSETEAQQLQFPVTLPIILALMLMFLAIRDPSGTLVRICSFIPFFSPIVMMVRVCVVQPPAWEIASAVAVLILSVLASIWLAGRIFRVGLLMYGKRPNLPELMRWIRSG